MTEDRPIFDPDLMVGHRKRPAAARHCTVSQLNAMIKQVLADSLPGTVYLVGQISNLNYASSGHLYLTLKDDHSEIRAVIWRSMVSHLKFEPADGLEVIATGYVDVYAPRGYYQFQIRKLEPRGVGALELAFRQLCDRLDREGLFDPDHKKPIPRFPRRVAVVTSPTGAAVRDILQTLTRRFPALDILLLPVRVQGEGAAREIADAIQQLNRQNARLGGLDLMIVGRGGGSIEDLWAFNEEIVARAIHASDIPIISAVGHEIDTTIADLVADLRAPTPTAAAELAVPVLDELLQTITNQANRLRRAVLHRRETAQSHLAAIQRFAWFRDPLAILHHNEQRLDEASSRLRLSWVHRIGQTRRRLHEIEIVLAAIQPVSFLQQQRNRLNNTVHRLQWAAGQSIRRTERQVETIERTLIQKSPRYAVRSGQDRVQRLTQDLTRVIQYRFQTARQNVNAFEARIKATSYHQTLRRGFTITRTHPDGSVITHPRQVSSGKVITTETAEGQFTSRVETS